MPTTPAPSGAEQDGAPPTAPDEARRAKRRARNRVLKIVATVVVVGVVGVFFGRTLASNWEDVAAQDLAVDGWWALAVLLFALAVPLTGLCWARIVRVLAPGLRVGASEAVAVQSLSWLLKYLPGQVGSVANKVLWASRRGASRTMVILSFVYENVFLLLASMVPAVAILFVSLGGDVFGQDVALVLLPLLVLVPVAVVLWRPAFHAIVSVPARRALKRDVPRELFLSPAQSLRSAVEFLGPRVLNGAGFVVIAVSISDIGPGEWLPFAAAYVLAGAIGILAFLVPSGIGVREAVIVLFVSQYVPVAEAIVLSLVARLLATLADAVVAGLYLATRRAVPEGHPS